MHKYQRFSVDSAAAVGSLVVKSVGLQILGSLVRTRGFESESMQNFFPHIDLEYYVFLDLTKNCKSEVDERGHRLRFFHTPRRGGRRTFGISCEDCYAWEISRFICNNDFFKLDDSGNCIIRKTWLHCI